MATTPKDHSENRIGSPALWLFTRSSQLVWLIITMKAIYDARVDRAFTDTGLSLGAIFLALSLVLHSFSRG